jgi:hypothetical protein
MAVLSGSQAEAFWKGVREAYDLDEFRRLLRFALDKRLDNITLGASFDTRVYDVIENAERENWVLRLISAACDARPDNIDLRGVAAEVGLTAAPSSLKDARVAGSSLERIILDSPFHDIRAWRVRLGELEGQVCRVEFPAGRAVGTGFLVGPDLVLTNYHVIEELADGTVASQEARLRFDYRRAASGVQVFEGTVFNLADDWLVASGPPSSVDEMPDPGGLVPAPGELDFAVLRVRGAPGHQRVGFAAQVPEAPMRGWVRASEIGADGFAAPHILFILQHPKGDPLKLAFGQSEGLNANETRLRYQVNTEHGSSGSPCLNARLELVGPHHAGDPSWVPRYNAAVPIAAIQNHLAGSAVAAELLPG